MSDISTVPFYSYLEQVYGKDFCTKAGYFHETKEWDNNVKYFDHANLPDGKTVIQFSGAFYPLHEGHIEIIQKAYQKVKSLKHKKICVVLHVDHREYRESKGEYSESLFASALVEQLTKLIHNNGKPIDVRVVMEDHLPNGCSRNFTRLYNELALYNDNVYFLAGGDRANYALTFIDRGKCIVVGRETSENFQKYRFLSNKPDIHFIGGVNPMSSSAIRQGYNNK